MNNPIKSVCNTEKQSKKSRKFVLVLAISIAALILAEATLAFPDRPLWIKLVVVFAHVPFTIFAAIYGWRFLKKLDELQRLIHMQAFIIGITGAGTILLSYSLLMSAGLIAGEMTWLFWSLLWFFYSVGHRLVSRRY